MLVASAPGAQAVKGRGGERPAKTRVLDLNARLVQSKLLDLDDVGFGLGDQAVFADELTAPNGRSAGFDGGVCTVVRVDDAVTGSGILQCLVTMSLKGGTITTQGLSTVKNLALIGTEAAAITGGTGRFRATRGQGLIRFTTPGKARIRLTISR